MKSFSGNSFTSSVEASVTEDKGQEFFMTLMTEHLGNIFIPVSQKWMELFEFSPFDFILWQTSAKTCKSGVQWYTNQVCIRTQHSHWEYKWSKESCDTFMQSPCSEPMTCAIELSVLFIRCSHNCHLHCDECYTLDLTSCVSWGFQWNHFFAFGQW